MLSLVQSLGLAREGLAVWKKINGKSTLGTCIWGGVKTDVVLVDLDPSDKQQMWNG